jgi:hypothetical protein
LTTFDLDVLDQTEAARIGVALVGPSGRALDNPTPPVFALNTTTAAPYGFEPVADGSLIVSYRGNVCRLARLRSTVFKSRSQRY